MTIVAVGDLRPQQTPKFPFVDSFFASALNCGQVHGLAGLESPLADGEREQRVDQLLLLATGDKQLPARCAQARGGRSAEPQRDRVAAGCLGTATDDCEVSTGAEPVDEFRELAPVTRTAEPVARAVDEEQVGGDGCDKREARVARLVDLGWRLAPSSSS